MLRSLLILVVAYGAFGQTYTINTIAGGGLPVNIPGGSASLSPVGAIAIDDGGDVYMTLPEYNVVVRRGALNGTLTLVAGNGTAGFSGDGGPATSAQLCNPTGLAMNPTTGVLYVADAGNARIRKISAGNISTVAGTGAVGPSGDGGPAVAAQLWPIAGARTGFGLALDFGDNLYIADTGNYRVRRVRNNVITTVAGTGIQGYGGDNTLATTAQLFDPQTVAVDSSGNLFIADGNRIRRMPIGGNIVTVAGSTFAGSVGENVLAINAQLSGPGGIAVDPYGNLLIADTGNNRIREVSLGVIATVAGTELPGFSGDGGFAASAQLNAPVGVALDSTGDLFIADGGNSRIRVVATDGTISTLLGGGSSIGDKGLASQAQLLNPQDVAVNAAGDMYIADFGQNRIREVSGIFIKTIAGTGTAGLVGDGGLAASARLSGPASVALDSAGNVYVADSANNRVREISGGTIFTIAGTGSAGSLGDGGLAKDAQLNDPTGVTVDSLGNVYIADSGNNRVRRVSSGIITTVAGNGTAGFGGDDNLATAAELSAPQSVAVDANGNLYIADSLNHRVRLVSNGVITTVAGGGTVALGTNSLATGVQIGTTAGVAVDSAGTLFVTDLDNHAIDRVTGGIITTVAGTGTGGFSGDGGPSASAQLYYPAGLTVGASNIVYVADSGNQRIRSLYPSGTACTYAVTPSAFGSVSAAGGNLVATIDTPSFCHWAVQGLPPWIVYSDKITGAGAATVTLLASADAGVARSAVVSIAGVPVLVSQAGAVVGPPPASAPTINSGGILNDASYTAPIAPGSIAAAYGDFLLTSGVSGTQPNLPFSISGLSLEFGGTLPVPLFYVSATQVNFQVPWEVAAPSRATLTATLGGLTGDGQTVAISPFAPAIFAMNAQGSGQGAILSYPSYELTDATHPAIAGSTYVMIYCTGLGAVTNQPADGMPAASNPLSWTTTTPSVMIGQTQAGVTYWGLAPGYAGLYQVNALVPAASAKGSAVPVTITINGETSNVVTIGVQ